MLKNIKSAQYPENWLGSFAVKSLMVAGRYLGCQAALEAARLLVERTMTQGRIFTPDKLASGACTATCARMVGMADYACW
jgi:hypothetical protein